MMPKSSNDQHTGNHAETRRQKRTASQDAMVKTKHSDQLERIQTPLRQISELQIKSQVKRPKLFSSKSLSRLVTRTLFFTKPATDNANETTDAREPTNKLTTTKSFPCNSTTANFRWQTNPFVDGFMEKSAHRAGEEFVNRVNSESLIGFGSTSTMLDALQPMPTIVDCTLEQPNLSPIIGSQMDEMTDGRKGCKSLRTRDSLSVPMTMSSTRVVYTTGDQSNVADSTGSSGIDMATGDEHQTSMETDRNSSNNSDKSSTTTTKTWKKATKLGKPFKNTTTVLRDVKNSLGLVSDIRSLSVSNAILHLSTPLQAVQVYCWTGRNLSIKSS